MAKYPIRIDHQMLTKISETFKIEGKTGYYAKFKCECGNECVKVAKNVKRGLTKSCGCSQYDRTTDMKGHELYGLATSLLMRVNNPNATRYDRYGGRGIKCELGNTPYEVCLAIEGDIGTRPSKKHTLDRIDNDGHYETGNIKWSTQREQLNNRSNSNKTVGVRNTKTGNNKDWMAYLKADGVNHRKLFETEQEAIDHRQYLEGKYL